ncbi:MAG: PD40 domain-containing protein [Alphaproteobacteria bacterium]|nr:PD40 domain-containing protein [Alphaproteobacteria bacterium]
MSAALLLLALSTAPARAAGARAVSPPTPGNCQSPRWSRDGARLAYEVNDHDRKVVDLFVYTPGAGAPRQVLPVERGGASLTAGFAGPQKTVAHEASWSPPLLDRLVYSAATGAAGDFDLYMDRAGALSPAPGADGGPAWSPDGRWIAFSSARTGQGDLYVIDAHRVTEPPRRLTSAPTSAELFPAWSPDGGHLVYVAHTDQGDNLFLVDDVQAGTSVQLTRWSDTQTRPSWSPDGRQVAFYSNHTDDQRWDLYVVEARAGATPRKLLDGVVMDRRGPSWHPDGKRLVVVSDDDDAYDPIVQVQAADGRTSALDTGTVGNGDLDLARGTDGQIWLAIAAQGRADDEVRDYKRIFVMPLP